MTVNKLMEIQAKLTKMMNRSMGKSPNADAENSLGLKQKQAAVGCESELKSLDREGEKGESHTEAQEKLMADESNIKAYETLMVEPVLEIPSELVILRSELGRGAATELTTAPRPSKTKSATKLMGSNCGVAGEWERSHHRPPKITSKASNKKMMKERMGYKNRGRAVRFRRSYTKTKPSEKGTSHRRFKKKKVNRKKNHWTCEMRKTCMGSGAGGHNQPKRGRRSRPRRSNKRQRESKEKGTSQKTRHKSLRTQRRQGRMSEMEKKGKRKKLGKRRKLHVTLRASCERRNRVGPKSEAQSTKNRNSKKQPNSKSRHINGRDHLGDKHVSELWHSSLVSSHYGGVVTTNGLRCYSRPKINEAGGTTIGPGLARRKGVIKRVDLENKSEPLNGGIVSEIRFQLPHETHTRFQEPQVSSKELHRRQYQSFSKREVQEHKLSPQLHVLPQTAASPPIADVLFEVSEQVKHFFCSIASIRLYIITSSDDASKKLRRSHTANGHVEYRTSPGSTDAHTQWEFDNTSVCFKGEPDALNKMEAARSSSHGLCSENIGCRGNDLINFYGCSKKKLGAENVFDKMHMRTFASWNSIVSAHMCDFDANSAIILLDKMEKYIYRLKCVIAATTPNITGVHGVNSVPKNFVAEQLKPVLPNTHVYVVKIDMLLFIMERTLVRYWLFDRGKSKDINVGSHATMIQEIRSYSSLEDKTDFKGRQ